MMKGTFITSIALATFVFGQDCCADILNEIEPNNTPVAAQQIMLDFNTGLTNLSGSITPGDVDFFQLTFSTPAALGVFVDPIGSDPLPPHILALFNSQGSQVSFGFVQAGTYTIGLTGEGDFNFLGAHTSNFDYQMMIAYSPSAPSGGLFAVAMLIGPRRRRVV